MWFSMESPSHCPSLSALDGYFNLTMSYRRDSDIFTPYGWLEPWLEPPVQTQANLSAKTDLVAWVGSTQVVRLGCSEKAVGGNIQRLTFSCGIF